MQVEDIFKKQVLSFNLTSHMRFSFGCNEFVFANPVGTLRLGSLNTSSMLEEIWGGQNLANTTSLFMSSA